MRAGRLGSGVGSLAGWAGASPRRRSARSGMICASQGVQAWARSWRTNRPRLNTLSRSVVVHWCWRARAPVVPACGQPPRRSLPGGSPPAPPRPVMPSTKLGRRRLADHRFPAPALPVAIRALRAEPATVAAHRRPPGRLGAQQHPGPVAAGRLAIPLAAPVLGLPGRPRLPPPPVGRPQLVGRVDRPAPPDHQRHQLTGLGLAAVGRPPGPPAALAHRRQQLGHRSHLPPVQPHPIAGPHPHGVAQWPPLAPAIQQPEERIAREAAIGHQLHRPIVGQLVSTRSSSASVVGVNCPLGQG